MLALTHQTLKLSVGDLINLPAGGKMQLDDPFPIKDMPLRARHAILIAFNGRCPSIGEVTSVSQAEWLRHPGIGQVAVAALRHIIQGLAGDHPTLTGLTNTELLAERGRVRSECRSLRASLHRQQDQLHAMVAKLLAELDRVRSEGKSQSSSLRALLHQQQEQLHTIMAELRRRNLLPHQGAGSSFTTGAALGAAGSQPEYR
jgi:hypothetical protein